MTDVFVSPKHQVVCVPFLPAVRNLFPSAPQMDVGGAPHLVLPHRPTETYLLRKLGFDVPAPIAHHYAWPGVAKPFDVQVKTCAMLTMSQRGYVLNGMGTGKTKAALWAWDYLRGNGLAGKLLVVAPLSTLTFTWAREVLATVPHRKCVVLHGAKAKRLERASDKDAEIYIVNHDGLKIVQDTLDSGVDCLVIDELAVYRNGGAARTKAMRKFAAGMKWVWGMTGSPIPHGPTDAWAQASIITPDRVPKFFGHFRQELCLKVSNFKWVAKPNAVSRVYEVLQPAVRYSLDDVVELPDIIERTVDVELGPQQGRIYKELVKHCHSLVNTHEITAANAGAAMMKLLQIALGWVYAVDGRTVPLDNNKRIEALIDGIYSTDNKVLVFSPFKHALAGISDALTKEKIEHATVSGDTSASERAEIFNLFQNTTKFKVLNAHPQCLAHGITLTAADTVVWFGPVTSLEIFDQANHRIRRVGQKHKQQILLLQGTPVERRIYSMLRGHQQVQNKLLELFENATT